MSASYTLALELLTSPCRMLPTYQPLISKINYVTEMKRFTKAWDEFYEPGMTVIGLDCEFGEKGKPSCNTVALLQLTGPRSTILYHCALIPGTSNLVYIYSVNLTYQRSPEKQLPEDVVRILGNKEVIKSGVGILGKSRPVESFTSRDHDHAWIGDAHCLANQFSIPVVSCLELTDVTKEMFDYNGGLADLCKTYLNCWLPKDKGVGGNWWSTLGEQQKICGCLFCLVESLPDDC